MAKQKQMRRVKPFTPEQGAILKLIMETPKILATTVQVHLLALLNLLLEKKVITREQFDNALQQTRARLMVEQALSPEFQAAEEKIRAILQRLGLAEEARPMPRRSERISLLGLLLLGGAFIVNEQGDVVGRAQERPGGAIDLFDAHSNRLGWGRQDRSGDVELFDMRGNRIGTWQRDRGLIRLEGK